MGGDLFSGENPVGGDPEPVRSADPDDPDGGQAVGRTGGRKPGSANRHDGKLGAYIAAQYGRTPAQELARRAFLDPAVYAKENGLARKDGSLDVPAAARRQEKLLLGLLPYTEKRMPTDVNIVEERRVGIALGVVSGPDGGASDATGRTIDMVPANVRRGQQKQSLSAPEPEKSDKAKSDMRD